MRARALLLHPVLPSRSGPGTGTNYRPISRPPPRLPGREAVSAWRAGREGGLNEGQVDHRHLSLRKT